MASPTRIKPIDNEKKMWFDRAGDAFPPAGSVMLRGMQGKTAYANPCDCPIKMVQYIVDFSVIYERLRIEIPVVHHGKRACADR